MLTSICLHTPRPLSGCYGLTPLLGAFSSLLRVLIFFDSHCSGSLFFSVRPPRKPHWLLRRRVRFILIRIRLLPLLARLKFRLGSLVLLTFFQMHGFSLKMISRPTPLCPRSLKCRRPPCEIVPPVFEICPKYIHRGIIARPVFPRSLRSPESSVAPYPLSLHLKFAVQKHLLLPRGESLLRLP